MSTRCQIGFTDGKSYSPILLYKHSDGYPKGILPILEKIVSAFVKDRGADGEYLPAYIMREWAVRELRQKKTLREKYRKVNKKEPPAWYFGGVSVLGWGITTDLHGDIEYLYVVNIATGSIRTVDTFSDAYETLKYKFRHNKMLY